MKSLFNSPGACSGIAFNLDEGEIGVVLLGDYAHLKAGGGVTRTGRVMDVAVGQPRDTRSWFRSCLLSIFSGVPSETSGATIVVRTTGDPLSLSLPVQKQVSALDPALPVYEVLTLPQIVGNSTANQSFSATLVLGFALLSLLLAVIGLYGVLSYLVTQRVTEIGIRLRWARNGRRCFAWCCLMDCVRLSSDY